MPTLVNVGFQCCPDICQRQTDVAPTYICYQGGYVIAKHHVLGYSVSNYTLKIEIFKPITTNDKKLILTV